MDFLTDHNLLGLIIGVVTFLIIGLFHPLVVKAEYYIGTKSWWIFLFSGITCIVLSLIFSNILLSTIAGVWAFSSFWSILEVFEQKKRVEKGWFPANPKKTKKQMKKRTIDK
ncbi:MAG: DUF4491 family protein [Prevotellaceae bacterium]|jgi:hypothetical protein|nr:DUF4491 family protein [Prevotellaceae bacterium]